MERRKVLCNIEDQIPCTEKLIIQGSVEISNSLRSHWLQEVRKSTGNYH